MSCSHFNRGVVALLLLAGMSAAVQAQLVTPEWIVEYGTPGVGLQGQFIALSPEGGICVAGRSGGYPSCDYLTTKFSPDSVLLWSATYNGPANGVDQICALAVDTQGNVYVTGISGTSADRDFATIKYDSAGVQQWLNRYDSGQNDHCAGLAVDEAGNVYVAGQSQVNPLHNCLTLVKYDSTGNQVWVVNYTVPGGYENHQASGIDLDSQGNILLAADNYGSENRNSVLLKYSPAGQLLWQTIYPQTALDWSTKVVVGENDAVYLAGTKWLSSSHLAPYVAKYSPAGQQLWNSVYSAPPVTINTCLKPVLDADGNVILGCNLGYDYGALKYNSAGELQWAATWGNPSLSSDAAMDVAVDDEGNVYVTGSSCLVSSYWDCNTVKFDAQGQFQWLHTYGDNPGNSEEGGYAVAADGEGHVYVAGLCDVMLDYQVLLIKLDQADLDLTFTLVPMVLPIQMPATGGVFDFLAFATNNDSVPQAVNLWTKQILPNGAMQSPVLGPVSLTLPPGTLGWFRHQNVPGTAPAGSYTYIGCLGVYPNGAWAADSLVYAKQTRGVGEWVDDWANWGDPFPGQAQPALLPSGLTLEAFPNPFNPETAVGYRLSAPGLVSLRVYDTAGRVVATLVDGWREAGAHEATFDASGFPSGIYFARLEAGSFTQTQKLILLK